MKKALLLITLVSLVGCAYDPVIDTGGRSGTFNENKASEINGQPIFQNKFSKTKLRMDSQTIFSAISFNVTFEDDFSK